MLEYKITSEVNFIDCSQFSYLCIIMFCPLSKPNSMKIVLFSIITILSRIIDNFVS